MKSFLKTLGDWVVALSIGVVFNVSAFICVAMMARTYLTIVPTAPVVGWLVIVAQAGVAAIAADASLKALSRFGPWARTDARITAFGRGLMFYTIFFFAAIFTIVANATMWVAEKTMNQAERYQN